MKFSTSFTRGFALSMPSGMLLGHTYRETEAASIATIFLTPGAWEEALGRGWDVRPAQAIVSEVDNGPAA